ncbi:Arginyl-tRNA--protein transferase 1 [Komagataella phaffii CBS 7435]|uniref:arginyltransferase n=2 Tax=Komagataella phaffii TaxID=460519 RepID=C4R7S5_KOMPG|nr:Arginyl-tRNA-protein transferase [Komagataella phaffii GS115]AOA65200.1 GQ67_04752T0 [Komagataella phaffii]CAH2450966.1 Arginyl-tRNA--protein transferase 1 [Komagataella phaffii CBS 7435]AOA70270.1 GQ68_04723T0 [Komagataella phaffii GS115]CAY71650.1 Arginyl-tRNA-protein transferase [Komagataella phaffii GS115]CCA40746.1 Arginyl-tRNA--protein transferase 1 [Komagataella phaffii CBS 7435]
MLSLTNTYSGTSSCGYCKGKKPIQSQLPLNSSSKEPRSSKMSYSELQSIDTQIYEALLNRGHRRSGCLLYLPDNLNNCCRHFTIRTSLSMLKPTKEHRHHVNRLAKYIGANIVTEGPFDLKSRLLDAELGCDSSRFYTEFESTAFSEAKYALFKKYQMVVHGDKDVTEEGFKRFLCDNPFVDSKEDDELGYWKSLNSWKDPQFSSNGSEFLGGVHECYYIDGKLAAIAVLDLLPNCVSSVYFIWDPEYAHLGLGTLSALRETVLAERLGKQFYYMGYYIADCPKMKYKFKFGGQLLDLCNSQFIDFARLTMDSFYQGKFIVTDVDGKANKELKITSSLKPSSKNLSPLHDIAEDIYGPEGQAYKEAQLQITCLKDQYHIEFGAGKEKDTIPLVCPGLIPLWQMSDLLKSGEMDNLQCLVFVYSKKAYLPITWYKVDDLKDEELVENIKRTIFNLVRFLGDWKLLENSLIYDFS